MEVFHIILGAVIVIVCFELVKHLFFKKTSKLFMVFLLVLIFFLVFSYAFKDSTPFQDNKFIQTGGVIAEEVVQLFKERIGTEEIINSTVKSNKLFKS